MTGVGDESLHTDVANAVNRLSVFDCSDILECFETNRTRSLGSGEPLLGRHFR